MTFKIDTSKGWTEAIIDSDGKFSKFERVASVLKNRIDVDFTKQLNDFDSYHLDFFYNDSALCLHYNIYLGVSIFPTAFKNSTQKDNENVIAVATALMPELEKFN